MTTRAKLARAVLAAALLSVLGTAGAARADTTIGGEITISTTLTAAGGPWLLTSDLIVRNSATLTLQAGAVVRVSAGASLIVEAGSLRALGTSGQHVVITSAADQPGMTPAAGDWGFLRFLNGTNDATARLEFTDLRYGQGVTIQGASPALESVTIRFMSGPAISIDLASFPTGSDNAATDNALNAVLVASGEMTASGAWALRGIPYVLQGPVSIGSAPTVGGVTPINVEQDSSAPASISGTRLDGSTGVAFSDTGVTADVLLGGTSTALPILIHVDPAAPLGTRTFTVDAAAGLTDSGAVVVNVIPGTPIVQSLVPPVAPQGAPDTTVVIHGRKFNAASVARLNGSAVATQFVSPTQLSIVIPASNLTAAGTITITVANPDPLNPGQFLVSAATDFTISLPPTVLSISPTQGARGATVNAAIGGSNLLGATSVDFGADITATIQPGGTATNVPVQIVIDPGATTGPRTFTVNTPAGAAASGSVTFTVTVSIPIISGITPSVGILGTSGVTVTVNGLGFSPDSKGQFNGVDRTTRFIGTTKLELDLTAADLSALGTFPIRVVNPDAANPPQTQISNSASFQVVQPTLSLTPSPFAVQALQSATLTITLSIPAPPGGTNVTLTPFAPLVATVNGLTSASVHVNENETQATASIEGVILNGGSTTITATAGGFISANVTVNVAAAPRIHVTPATVLVGTGKSANVTVSSTVTAPAGGILVTLVVAPTGVVTAPATVTILQNTTSVQATITGMAVGAANIRGTAAGFTSGTTCDVTVRPIEIVLPGSILVSPGLTRPFTVTLTDPAPAGGTTVNFASSNGAAADPPASIQIPAGMTSGSASITGKAAGSTTITASDPAAVFGAGTMVANVQAVNITFAPVSGSAFKGSSFALHPSVFINAAAPAGGQVINLSSSNTAVATVPASVTIPQGQTSTQVEVTGVGPGSATITPSAAGLNTTGTFAFTVVDTVLNFFASVGGFGVQSMTGVRRGAFTVNLPSAAPSAIDVTIASLDPNVALVATYNTTAVPSSSINVTIPAGSSAANFDLIGASVLDFTDLSSPVGLALHGPSGDVYIAEQGNDRVRRVAAASGVITTFAGTSQGFSGDTGPALSAQLGNPSAGVFDAAGNFFIADQSNHRIRRVDAATGNISTVAGNGSFSCGAVRDGQPATSAGLCNPTGITFDAQGRLIVADQSFQRIRLIVPGADGIVDGDADEIISTIAGNGNCNYTGDGGLATSATLCNPTDVEMSAADGALYISDFSNRVVRRVDLAGTGNISTVAGDPNFACTQVRDGQPAKNAGLCNNVFIALDGAGRLYISDRDWHRVRRVSTGVDNVITGAADEIITTIAGNGSCGFNGNGRAATAANICSPHEILALASGHVLFADASNHQIRDVDTATGLISTFAGSGEAGLKGDGNLAVGALLQASSTGFITNRAPVAMLPSSLYLSGIESSRNTLSAPNVFSILVGHPNLGFGFRLAQPITIDLSSTNPGAVTVPATTTIGDNAVQSPPVSATVAGIGTTTIMASISPATPTVGPIAAVTQGVSIVQATMGVNSDPLSPNGDNHLYTGTGVRNGAWYVTISGPAPTGGITVHLTVSDPNKVLIAPYNTTMAGTAALDVDIPEGIRTSTYFDLIGLVAFDPVALSNPNGITVDPNSGAIYIVDTSNNRIRRVDPATGILTTVAGDGNCTFQGDDGAASSASLCSPRKIELDAAGNIFIADTGNHRVRRVDRVTGKITTVAGNGSWSCFQLRDGQPATDAGLCNPSGLVFDATGALLIGDQSFHRVRRVIPGGDALIAAGADAANETISTVAGNGNCTFGGDTGAATSASMCNPVGVALDATGALYIADQSNHRVRRVSTGTDAIVGAGPDAADEIMTTVAGNGTCTFGGDTGAATSASLCNPLGVSFNAAAQLMIADQSNHRIRRIAVGGSPGITGDADEIITTIAGTGQCGYNGDGQPAALASLCNPSEAIEANGDLWIADQSLQRIRKVEAATGLIRTAFGTGGGGFSGDGSPASGVRITATATGFASNDAQTQSSATNLDYFSTVESSRNTLSANDTFQLFLNTPGVGSLRAATDLTVNVTSSDPNVEAFSPGPAPSTTVTIANNTNASTQGTLQVTGAGSTTIAAAISPGTPPLGPIGGASQGVNIVQATLGVNTDPLFPTSDNTVRTGAGMRNGGYFAISSGPAPTGGITVHLTSGDPNYVLLAPFTTTTAPTASLDVTIPQGNRLSSRFDLVGVSLLSPPSFSNPSGVTVDPNTGVIYIADTSNCRVRRVDPATGILTTIAGNGSCSFSGESVAGTSASLNGPRKIALDAAGNIFIADMSNHRVRRVDRVTGTITTVAGNGSYSCSQVRDGQAATDAGLCNPVGLAFDSTGALLIGDQSFHRIRRVSPGTDAFVAAGADAANELITTVAGNGSCTFGGDTGAATSASLCNPVEIALDATGALYIADQSNQRIRRVSTGADAIVGAGADAANELITTVAGNGNCTFGGDTGAATSASLCNPWGVSFNGAAELMVADLGNHRIRKIAVGGNAGVTGEPDETITTIAGTGQCTFNGDGQAATLAGLCNPTEAVEIPGGGGDLFIADQSLHRIRRVEAATKLIRTAFGTGSSTFSGDGFPAAGVRITGTAAGFPANDAPALVAATNLAFTGLETSRNTLSANDPFQVFLTTPGIGNLRAATPLTVDLATSDPNVEAFSPGPTATTTVAIANNQNQSSAATLQVTGAGSTTIGAAISASTPPAGPINAVSQGVSIVQATLAVGTDPLSPGSDSRLPTGTGARMGAYQAVISGPAPAGGIVVHLQSSDPSKALLAPFSTTNAGAASLDVTVPAGSRNSSGFDVIGVAASPGVLLNNPSGLALDTAHNALYWVEISNHRVRRVDLATGVLSTVAGNGTQGSSGDGGAATAASLNGPQGIALDASGNMFVADTSNHRIRRIDLATGTIVTVAGTGACAFSGEGGPATSASMCNPVGLAFDASGALIISDQSTHRIRRVIPGSDGLVAAGADTANETITTIAGNGSCTFAGDSGPATSASLCNPLLVAADATGALFVADQSNHRIRRIEPGAGGTVTAGADAANETITTVAGTGACASGGDGGAAKLAGLCSPWGVSLNAAGDLIVTDRSNQRIRKIVAGASAGVTGDPDETITTIAGTGTCAFNGEGKPATLASVCNPGQAIEVPGSGGDLLLADQSLHRIRKIEGSTGVMRTAYGTGAAGFIGDGGVAAGVRITGTATGFTSNDAQADVRQSSFRVNLGSTSVSALSTTFSVGIEPAGLGCCQRASDPVSIDVTPNDPTVLSPATPLNLANNSSSTGTQTLSTVGSGSSAIVASTLSAAINPGVSAVVTVVPTVTGISPAAGRAGSVVNGSITGTNLSNASNLTVSGTGVAVAVGTKTNTTIPFTFTIDPLAEPATRTVTVTTPGGTATIGFLVTTGAVTTLRMTDMTQFLANANGTTQAGFRHNTYPADGIWQLGVTSPAVALPSGSAITFLNPGGLDLDLPLSLGSNTFTIAGDSVTTGTPFGLSLFFNDEIIPGIAVYNANGGAGGFSVQTPEASVSGDATGGAANVPAPGVTSYATSDGYSVTLSAYTMKSASSPFVDVVGSANNVGAPNGTADTYGALTLDVAQPGNMQGFASLGYAPAAGFTALAPSRTTISFDESSFPDGSANPSLSAGQQGTEITTQYSSLGVTLGSAASFPQTFIYGQFGPAFQGKSLGNATSTSTGQFQMPVAASFASARSAVGVVVVDGDAGVGIATLTAYSGPNGTGTALASVASPGGAGNDPYFLGLVDTGGTPRIRSVVVRFQRTGGSDLAIDDLTFNP